MKWAARLLPESIATLDPLRLSAGIEWCAQESAIWLRGTGEIPRNVPWSGRYEIHGETALHESGRLLPAGRLPAGPWLPLAEALGLTLPPVAREGLAPQPIALSLARSPAVQAPSLMEITAEAWRSFGETAPDFRLDPLRFARTDSGRVFVQGRPLPSVPGERFVVQENVAVPAGFTWSPAVTLATLRSALQLAEEEFVLFLHGGACLRIPARAWSPASRALIRAYDA
jgi:hypothetical protein